MLGDLCTMIVTIDGPAGSGKSTTAQAVARRLGFRHLDSGAFYRALTLAALRAGVSPEIWDSLEMQELAALAVSAKPDAEGFRLLVDGQDVATRLRSPEVNANVSRMARVPAVRRWLMDRLRGAAENCDLVADGRDMGTVVFPHAEVKVFLTADVGERATRRLVQQGEDHPRPAEIDAEVARLAERDRIDSERTVAPLRRAEDAIAIDNTSLTFDEQVEYIVALVRSRSRT
ncbi:MAG: (d)CMP kinase [Longimicrobiales bacterium]